MNDDQYPRIFRPHGCNSLYVELQFEGERHRICLNTLDPDLAKIRAKERCDFARTHGWKAYFIKYKPRNLTFGEYWSLFERKRGLPPKTLRGYRQAFKIYVSYIDEWPDNRAKYGRKKNWFNRERDKLIDAVRLSSLSPEACEAWKVIALTRCSPISVHSYLCKLKALFNREAMKLLGVHLSDPLPFSTVPNEKPPVQKYLSNLNHPSLIEDAKAELRDQDPEVFKAFLLGEFFGLKRGEIDRLEWKAFLWEEDVLHIEGRQAANLPIEPGVKLQFRHFHRKATGNFVIESTRRPRPDVSYNYYRCKEVLDRLVQWLGTKGASGKKLSETLRKEFGSRIYRIHGIGAASEAMRHKSVRITEQCIANPVKATTGLGYLL